MNELIRRGYHVGEGVISPDRQYFYLGIPKNASTYTTNVLQANKWEFWNLNDPEYNTVIVTVRDPVERWISGIATYCCSYLLSSGYGSDHFVEDYNELVERLLFDNVIFDDHTQLQTKFISTIPHHANRIYVWSDRNTLISSLSEVTGLDIQTDQLVFDNSKETNYDTNQISSFIRSRLTPDLTKKLKQHYYDDYRLLESVKIHGTR